MKKVLHLGARRSVIVTHLLHLLLKNNKSNYSYGVFTAREFPRDNLESVSGVTRHFIPGTNTLVKQRGETSSSEKKNKTLKSRLKQFIPTPCWRFIAKTKAQFLPIIYRKTWSRIFHQYDTLHLQGMFASPEMDFILKHWKGNLIVSVWGSDLLRINDVKLIAKQQKLLRKADLVTFSGLEMREILLAKFGRSLKPKLKETFFSISLEVIDVLNKNEKNNIRKQWLDSHGIAEQKKVICIGHNASEDNNHEKIIQALSELSDEHKQELFCVVPMTYGVSSLSYKSHIKKLITSAGLQGVVLEEFLSEQEVAELRLATDILLYAPESDAFSATVSQAIMAGSIVICGAWLPYGTRRMYGFNYLEFREFFELKEVVGNTLNCFSDIKQKMQKNKQLSLDFFECSRVSQKWLDVYDELFQKTK